VKTEPGLQVDSIEQGSLAEASGILPGDTLLSVNAHKLRDPVDFLFYSTEDTLDARIRREGKIIPMRIIRKDAKKFGITFKPFRVMTCKNNCIFCFIKQLPKGLRKSLYIRDEDYRMSFLYGNYITLGNLTREEKNRIVEQRLSPLYISVHSTNRSVRNRLLGNQKCPDIMKELSFFRDNRIRFNLQVVLCPGYNDKRELRQTISHLSSFYPYTLSVAVVPVGLTLYKNQAVRPVEKEDAADAITLIEGFQKRFLKKYGNAVVYGADELYLKAERPFPPLKEYGEMHQIENGVGMVPLFMQQAKKIRIPGTVQREKPFLTFTGVSFYPFLKKFLERLSEREHITIKAVPVENQFLGRSVTVAGLLTGRDVIRTIFDKVDGQETILVPDVVLNDENRFLDDISLGTMEEALGCPVKKIPSTPEGLIRGITEKDQ
jgi:putative radical SAM enzyme (TIGR03279 family)